MNPNHVNILVMHRIGTNRGAKRKTGGQDLQFCISTETNERTNERNEKRGEEKREEERMNESVNE